MQDRTSIETTLSLYNQIQIKDRIEIMDTEIRDLGENMREMSTLLKNLTRTDKASGQITNRIERMDKNIQTGNELDFYNDSIRGLTDEDDDEKIEEDDGESIQYIYQNIPFKLVSKEDL